MTLPHTDIGSLTVARPGLGCMSMSLAYGRPDPDRARATLKTALDHGVTLFDTADVYGRGHNERLVAATLAGLPSSEPVTIATKIGLRTNLAGIPNRVDGRPAYLRRAIDASLRRLNRETIDLLYLHRIDPTVPVEDSIGALADAVQAGKVRDIGLSEATPNQVARAHATHPIAALQTEWSLFTRDIEATVLPECRRHDITVVAYAPLGRGMLTATPRSTTRLPLLDFRRTLPRWKPANLAANLAALTPLRDIAAQLDATPAQVALAWLLAQGNDFIPIPGTTNPDNLQQNLAATTLHLTGTQLQTLAAITPTGQRYTRPTPTPGIG